MSGGTLKGLLAVCRRVGADSGVDIALVVCAEEGLESSQDSLDLNPLGRRGFKMRVSKNCEETGDEEGNRELVFLFIFSSNYRTSYRESKGFWKTCKLHLGRFCAQKVKLDSLRRVPLPIESLKRSTGIKVALRILRGG